MLKIYFDNALIDSDNYISLKVNNKLFDDSFRLGSVPSETLTLEVPSSFSIPKRVTIKQDDTDYGHYFVDKAEYKDGDVLTLTLSDNLVLTEKPYNASTIIIDEEHPVTTKQIFEDICNKSGVEYDSSTFTTNNDVLVNYYDNTINGREYLSYLAELNGGYISQDNTGKIKFNKYIWTKNILDINRSILNNNGCTYSKIPNGIRVTVNVAGTYKYIGIKLDYFTELLGKKVTLSMNAKASASNTPTLLLYWLKDNALLSYAGVQVVGASKTATGTIATTPPTGANGIVALLYSNQAGTGNVGDYVDYTDVQIEIGNKTPYMPFVEGGIDKKQILLNTEDCENFKLGQQHEIERVVFDNGLVKYAKARESYNIQKPYTEYQFPYTKAGITMDYDEKNQIYTFSGTSTADNNTFTLSGEKPEIIINKTTSNVYWINGNVTGYCAIRYYDVNYGKSILYSMSPLTKDNANIRTIANSTFKNENACSIRFNNGTVANNFQFKIMLANEPNLDYEPYGDLSEWDNLETLYLNPGNVYITSQEIFDNIANNIIGFKYYNFSTNNCPIDIYAKSGDILRITDDTNEYASIIQYELNYNGTWLGGYELNLGSQIQQETQVIGDSPEQRAIKVTMNRLDNKIIETVVDIDNVKGDISTVEQNQNSISSLVAGLNKGYYEYTYTTDTTFVAAQEYFIEYDGVYEQLIWNSSQNKYTDSKGKSYTVGSAIPANTIYNREFIDGISQMKEQYNDFISTLNQQTADSITTWFANNKIDNQTYEQLLKTLSEQMENTSDILDLYQSFISKGLDTNKPTITSDTKYLPDKRYYTYNSSTDTFKYLVPGTDYVIGGNITTTTYESYHYNDPYIALGESTYQTTLRIYPNEIVFYTNDNRTAYLSNNSLYIEEQTILTKEKVGHWLTYEDDNGNLNTKWVEE